jgi:Fe2+ or Zn2+ uptake regulation protein
MAMFYIALKCDGCGADAGFQDEHGDREYMQAVVEKRGWKTTAWDWMTRHLCPTCRRAFEATDLRTALVQPRATVKEQA